MRAVNNVHLANPSAPCPTVLMENKDFYIKLFQIVLIFGQKLKIVDVEYPQADTVIVLSLSPVLSYFSNKSSPGSVRR